MRGKPKGSFVTSRPTKPVDATVETPEYQQFEDEVVGRDVLRPGKLAARCNTRWSEGLELWRVFPAGAGEYLLLWRRIRSAE